MQNSDNNTPKTYPQDIGVLYENTNKYGQKFLRGHIKRKDGTKFEIYAKQFTKPGVNAATGQPEIKVYYSITPYVPSVPGQQSPAAPVQSQPVAQMAPAVASSPAPQTVKIDDDIPF